MKTRFNSLKAFAAILLLSLLNNLIYAQNTKYGIGALTSNTTGYYNSAFGYFSLYSNTTGYSNTAVGTQALYSNTTGAGNAAIGNQALNQNTTGDGNTANGNLALNLNTSGFGNTAMGLQALRSNTVGNFNTAIGWLTMDANTTGISNTAIGSPALYHNTTGTANTAIGVDALTSNTTGFNNTATGAITLASNTTGKYNTAVGNFALYLNTTGNKNTAIGNNAEVTKDNLSNSTAIGNATLVTASNQVRIGSRNVTSIGGFVNWTSISDGRFKKNVKDNVKGLDFIMKLKPVSYTLDITGLNTFLHSHMKTPGGKKYNAPEEDAQDIKAKEQVVYSGFVAQDVEKAAKETGYDFSGVDAPKNDNDVYGLRYAEFVVPLVKAVQELSQQNNDLQKQINELKTLIATLAQSNNASQATNSITLSSAVLEQNIPNPFTSTTTISYTLPQQFTRAQIVLADKSGKTIKQINISGSGKGVLHIDAASLTSGAYSYSLIMDGKLISTKQMILAR